MRRILNWLPNLWSNPASAFGCVLTTVAAVGLLLLLGWDVSGVTLNPYAGAFFLVALPALFVLGLLLIPAGLWLYRKRRRATPAPTLGEAVAALFTTPAGRRKLVVLLLLTLANIVLLGAAGNRAIHWMESPTFCGTACHGVMQPEYDTYKNAPHRNVKCVDCHVGPGAAHLVRSKIDGLRQVWRTLRDTYERPVPAPVHSMRPAAETCQECHRPDGWIGNRLVQGVHTAPDEANSALVNVLVLKVGGKEPATGAWKGIHHHAREDLEIRYEALDAKRTLIGKVTVLEAGKVVREFLPPAGVSGEVHDTRRMDCIDCHNRPTHIMDASPGKALERGFAEGLLDRGTRWLRQVAEPVLARTDRSRDGVKEALRQDLVAAYQQQHPDALPSAEALDAAASGLAILWLHNIYPERGVVWGTYPSHAGHQTEQPALHGCFRCHDDKHATADGKKLSGECEICHEALAQDEKPEGLDDAVRLLLQPR